MSEQNYIASMTGYKATRADMTCRPEGVTVQYVLGEWTPEIEDIELCKRGYHFCVHPSGVWSYYSDPTSRVFKIEAEGVLEIPTEAGADFKLVARRIRLVEEVTPGRVGNGKSNTGYRNTGDRNTGYRNTGDRNTGNRNTGDRNTGDSNTGDSNTGDRNTGDRNTGDRNTGDRNTGNRNTGYGNTGDRNTGDRNTGYGNATNYSPGFFCQNEPRVICFDVQTKLTRDKFCEKYPEYYTLLEALTSPAKIEFEQFKKLPGITRAKLASLHKKHLEARKAV